MQETEVGALYGIGNLYSQRTVGSYMAVPPLEAGRADLSLPAIAVSPYVDLLILECPPQTFNQDVVVAALPSSPADLDLLGLKPRQEVR